MVRLEGTSEDGLVQPLYSKQVVYSKLPMMVSSQVLTVSKDGDSTTFLGNLFQYSIILPVKISLMTQALTKTTL